MSAFLSFARALVLSAVSLTTVIAGCGSDDDAGVITPTDSGGMFNDVITERPDDGVDSAKADSGTDVGTEAGGDGSADTGTASESGADATDTGATDSDAGDATDSNG